MNEVGIELEGSDLRTTSSTLEVQRHLKTCLVEPAHLTGSLLAVDASGRGCSRSYGSIAATWTSIQKVQLVGPGLLPVMAGRPFNLVPLMGTLRGYSSFNIRTHYFPGLPALEGILQWLTVSQWPQRFNGLST